MITPLFTPETLIQQREELRKQLQDAEFIAAKNKTEAARLRHLLENEQDTTKELRKQLSSALIVVGALRLGVEELHGMTQSESLSMEDFVAAAMQVLNELHGKLNPEPEKSAVKEV